MSIMNSHGSRTRLKNSPPEFRKLDFQDQVIFWLHQSPPRGGLAASPPGTQNMTSYESNFIEAIFTMHSIIQGGFFNLISINLLHTYMSVYIDVQNYFTYICGIMILMSSRHVNTRSSTAEKRLRRQFVQQGLILRKTEKTAQLGAQHTVMMVRIY